MHERIAAVKSHATVVKLRLVAVLAVLAATLGQANLQAAPPDEKSISAEAREVRNIRATLDALYDAFSFDAGGAPDWDGLRKLFLPGASFVDPVKPGTPPRAVGAEEFLAKFRSWVETNPKAKAGFRERIVAVRLDHFGHVAHAYVTFEGYVPAVGTAETHGLDSVQLVLDGGDWKVASFTTQYESPELPLPDRFSPPAPR
jgi:hypothetical protein